MSHRKFDDNQEQVIAKLYQEGWSYPRLAERFGVKFHLIKRVIHRQGVQPRHVGLVPLLKTQEQIQKAVILYKGGTSQEKIAVEMGVSQALVGRVLRQQGILARKVIGREQHGNWKGGRHLTSSGYVEVILDRDSPYFSMANRMGYILEHRLIMAKHLKRCLNKEETIHLKNGIKDDNRIGNLQLWNGRHGKGIILICADCGSRNIVAED